MTEALPNNAPYDIQQSGQVLFKKSLFGFKCDEVLNHIERLSAAASLEASRTTAEINSKTNEISLMRQKAVDIENQISEQKLLLSQETQRAEIAQQSVDEMQIKLQELNVSVDDTKQKLAIEEMRATGAEQEVITLRNSLSEVEFEAEELRSRIYAADKENNLLKSENIMLSDTIDTLTQAVNEYEDRKAIIAVQETQANSTAEKILAQANLDAVNLRTQASTDAASIRSQVNGEVANLRTQARQDADNILQEANSTALAAKREAAQSAVEERERLVNDARNTKERAEIVAKDAIAQANEQAQHILTDAQRDKNMKKVLLQGSCEDIAESVAVLRKELNDVDAKIIIAAQQMQNASESISAALELAEKNLEVLDIQVKTFPETQPQKAVKYDNKVHEPSFVKRPREIAKRSKISDGILDALNRILG